MHAVVIKAAAGPEVLRYVEAPPPEPGDREVLIRVHAASVNPIDASPASTIPPQARCDHHEQAAAIPVAGLTAWQALFDCAGLTAGQVALISGGNRDFVLGLGADHYVDLTRKDVADALSGVDATLDTVGGKTPRSPLGAVRDPRRGLGCASEWPAMRRVGGRPHARLCVNRAACASSDVSIRKPYRSYNASVISVPKILSVPKEMHPRSSSGTSVHATRTTGGRRAPTFAASWFDRAGQPMPAPLRYLDFGRRRAPRRWSSGYRACPGHQLRSCRYR